MPDDLTERSLEADELEEANRTVELDEQIDIAVVTPLIARERAKQGS